MSGRFWLQALLAASLAFNVAVIIMHCCIEPPQPPHGPEAFEARITHSMSKADADVVHAAFAKHKEEFADRRRVQDDAIAEVRKVLAISPVNQDQLKVALDKAQAARTATEQTMEEVMLDAAQELSPAGRDQLVPPMHDPHGAH